MLQCSKRGAVASEEKIMIAKNKSRKSPKTAVIARSTRSANSPEHQTGATFSGSPGHDAPKFFPFAAEELDTVTRSGLALADGIQAFGQALIEMQWRSVSAGLLAARGLVDARSPRDVLELQRRFVAGSLENWVRETGHLVQLAGCLAAEAWAPRVAAAPGRGSRS
jgi:hypothetical protein